MFKNILKFLGIFACFNIFYSFEGVYISRTGKNILTNFWKIEGEGIVASNSLEVQKVILKNDKSNLKFEYNNFLDNKFVVVRNSNSLTIEGTLKGKKISKKLDIDSSPWYQFLEVSLSDFVLSSDKNITFWILRPTDLALYKMEAVKEKEEEIDVDGQVIKALRVKVSLSGAMSAFWKAFYWYDKNGLFLKYRGVNGGPGTPETIIERQMSKN